MLKAKGYKLKAKRGQVMILAVLVLGGTLLGATTIGGLLVLHQIRQTTDLMNSAKAVYAADTAIEWGLHQFYKKDPGPGPASPLSNGATYRDRCFDEEGNQVDCHASTVVRILGRGESGNVRRAFQLSL